VLTIDGRYLLRNMRLSGRFWYTRAAWPTSTGMERSGEFHRRGGCWRVATGFRLRNWTTSGFRDTFGIPLSSCQVRGSRKEMIVKKSSVSRRQFLASSWIVLSTPGILAACSRAGDARQRQQPLQTLQTDEAAELEAMAARIIPSDETPGAREAGVLYFMDTVLGDDRESELAALRAGLTRLRQLAENRHGSTTFPDLTPSQQDELLRGIEETEFFATVRYLTVAGMFSLPDYGGNREGMGYDLIGFDRRFAWAPPFGYYDARYPDGGQ